MQKSKLLRNLLLVLLPIIAYYGVFVAFEPNNYFGLKKSADGTDIMATLRAYEDNPGDNIIVGDSRLAKLDPALVERTAKKTYDNLAYGGASLKEQLDLVDWAMQQNPQLSEVVFMLSFYNLNRGYNQDRMVIKALNNPLRYMTNLGYNINMLTNLYDHLAPQRNVGDAGETEDAGAYEYVDYTDPASGQTVRLRESMAKHLAELSPRSAGWKLNEEQFRRLLDTIESCHTRGIRFVVVLPPASGEVMEYIVNAYGIEAPMREVLQTLEGTTALVVDHEFSRQNLLSPEQFFDGFHLDEERGLNTWTEILFAQIANAQSEEEAGHGA